MTDFKVGDRVRYEVEGVVIDVGQNLVANPDPIVKFDDGFQCRIAPSGLTKIEPPRKTFAEQVEALAFGKVFTVSSRLIGRYVKTGGRKFASEGGGIYDAGNYVEGLDVIVEKGDES